MKKLSFVLLLLVLASSGVFAQDEKPENREEKKEEIDNKKDDKGDKRDRWGDEFESRKREKRYRRGEVKTLSGDHYHSGGFGAISFKGTLYDGETLMMAGVRGGWVINRAVALGFEGWGFIPTVKLTDVYPFNDVILLGGYGGFFIEPIFFSNEIVHVTFPVSGGAGWMGYNEDFYQYDYNTFLIDDDVFWYVEPGVALELNVSRHFRMDFGASKRFTQDLELINTATDVFDEWSYFLTLKFGGF